MSSTTLFRLSGIILLLSALISVIAGLLTLFFDSSLTASPSSIQSSLWSPYWSLIFVTLVLVPLGLPALYLRQARGRADLLGQIGTFLVVLGSFVSIAMVAYFVSIMPLLAQKGNCIITFLRIRGVQTSKPLSTKGPPSCVRFAMLEFPHT